MVRIKCLKCQTILPAEGRMAGTVLTCSQCGTMLRVPVATPPSSPQLGDTERQVDEPFPERLVCQDHVEVIPDDLQPPTEVEAIEEAISSRDAEVLSELERLQNQQPGWWKAFAILAISLLLFVGAAKAERAWHSIVILIGMLAFHEFGHYVAMRCFGYRNLRMFFIPFFGAAVSGRHYNVAGWKKAVVALAGPLPGILIGAPLGVVGLALREPKVIEVALLLLILNGFNLLPFLPLDGGWIVHAVLFVRHPALDVVFRLTAALCMLGLALLVGDWILVALAAFMLLALPIAWRLARVAYRLKKKDCVTQSSNNDAIPTAAALQILAELRLALPTQTTPRILAQNVANVFETLNARPPDVLASLGLLAVHGGSFLVALVMSIVLTVLQHRPV